MVTYVALQTKDKRRFSPETKQIFPQFPAHIYRAKGKLSSLEGSEIKELLESLEILRSLESHAVNSRRLVIRCLVIDFQWRPQQRCFDLQSNESGEISRIADRSTNTPNSRVCSHTVSLFGSKKRNADESRPLEGDTEGHNEIDHTYAPLV